MTDSENDGDIRMSRREIVSRAIPGRISGLPVEVTRFDGGLEVAFADGEGRRQVIARVGDKREAVTLVMRLLASTDQVESDLVKMVGSREIPADIAGFPELHDHFDANMLTDGMLRGCHISVGAPDREEAWCGAMNAIHEAINDRLVAGVLLAAAPAPLPGM